MSSQNLTILASEMVWIFFTSWVIIKFSCMQVHAAREGDKSLLSMNGRNLSGKEVKFDEHARRKLIPGSYNYIDCGIEKGSDYDDSESGISYVSDVEFVESGVNMKISDEFLLETQNFQKLLETLRSFPEGNNNCYTLKPTTNGGGNRYLIRAFFMYGNYDSKNQPPEFKLYLNGNEWDQIKLDNASQIVIKEIIHNPPTDYIHVCLVNVGSGSPFISALEIRQLNNTIYKTKENQSLVLYRRLDEGASSTTSNKFLRYKDDFYDRIWEVPDYWSYWESISTTYSSERFNDNEYKPSPTVMSTAVTPVQGNSLAFQHNADPDQTFYLYMHFLEVEALSPNETREFEIYLNNNLWSDETVVPSTTPSTWSSTNYVGGTGSLEFSFNMTKDSTLPPILNAIEFYIAKTFPMTTNQSDVEAMVSIKSEYGIKKNWQGDPCIPNEYTWNGLECNKNDQDSYRVISVNLSFSGLTNDITFSLSKLDSLQSLDLSHNDLTGTIPDFLANMPSLRTINLSGNKLEGLVPAALLDKMNNRTLAFSMDGNPDLCLSGPCTKKKAHIQRLTVIVVVSPIISCLLVIVIGVVIFKCRKKAASTKGTCDELKKEQGLGGAIVEPKKEQLLKPKGTMFKCSEIIEITSTFRTVIGRGGSSVVYLGCLEDGRNVAVKMLSSLSATCGRKQFLSEVEILIKIHHTNLVSFVGYCADGTTMALIYEHMANGNLRQHLSASTDKTLDPLSWKQRVQIALDAVQGLEYLHNGCKPSIIHRDLKSANILLNQKLQAKLADFGLSRIFASENDTHVTTTVAGTAGYLDPEYNNTFKFNEKSDVYSLGIVLLELITGKPAIIKGTDGVNIHIVEWVNKRVERGNIHEIVDPKLQGKFNINSAWKFLEAAMTCTMTMAIQRMSAMELLVELKQCLAAEMAEEIASGTPGLSQDDCLEIDSVPSAR